MWLLVCSVQGCPSPRVRGRMAYTKDSWHLTSLDNAGREVRQHQVLPRPSLKLWPPPEREGVRK